MDIPSPVASLKHFTTVELRFNDFDMLGHLNNSVFFELTDLAKARFMEWLLDDVDWKHLDLAIVNIDCSFYSQIFPDDKIGIYTGVKHIGDRSFTIEQRIVSEGNGKVFAITNSVFCAFDPVSLTSRELPLKLRKALEKVF